MYVIKDPLATYSSLNCSFFSFIYTLFLCMDTNFRQKNQYQAMAYEDISLSDSWAYFVKTAEYMSHISQFASQEEVSFRYQCTTHHTQDTHSDQHLCRFPGNSSSKFEENEGS